MGLVINHNLMASNAARNLSTVYQALSQSTQRLSSGLRVNSAADDAAGLAVRELMRADIAVLNQGVRNASDAISMIQTAEGALGVIDEKLIRMKELAEQAATGTYTTAQREIMDSEYQAMAAEIDRIANATDFNGVKMLDGSLETLHDGSGLKIHFGTGNSSAEDYYFMKLDDVRATNTNGLEVGWSTDYTDVWVNQTDVTAQTGEALSSTNGNLFFAMDYDYSRTAGSVVSTELNNIVGLYSVTSGTTDLQTLVDSINQGTAARVGLTFSGISGGSNIEDILALTGANSASTFYVEAGDVKVEFLGSAATAASDTDVAISASSYSASTIASVLTSAINTADGNVFAVWNGVASGASVMVFAKTAGSTGNSLTVDENISGQTLKLNFTGTGVNTTTSATSGTFAGGGEKWVNASINVDGDGNYHLQIAGNATGTGYDIDFYQASSASGYGSGGILGASGWIGSLTSYDEESSTEWLQTANASGTTTAYFSDAGRNILTQSAAQFALGALDDAINVKDINRASLGAFQNRLENTISQLEIQAENLQAAESRISDVDYALEVTEFTKKQIMVQAATSMLAQANSLNQIVLTLLR